MGAECLLLLLAGTNLGCVAWRSEVVGIEALIQAREDGHRNTVWRGLFYAGSDTSYHYFVDVNEPFSRRRWMAVEKSDIEVRRERTVTQDADGWVRVSTLDLDSGIIDTPPFSPGANSSARSRRSPDKGRDGS
jgi:hypothetical protein